MSEVFLGEIHIVAFSWAPAGWALCNGALLGVTQNTALFTLLGNKFGGNGTTNFALPDLRKRVPLCMGTTANGANSFAIGSTGGALQSTLTMANMSAHSHLLGIATPPQNAFYFVQGQTAVPVSTQAGNVSALPSNAAVLGVIGEGGGSGSTVPLYTTTAANVELAVTAMPVQGKVSALTQTDQTGAGAPFSTAMPYQILNYIIALSGVFPSRT